MSSTYVGRFAPSPTGPLHLGSLLTAVASYLDARSADGRWLVRIEDLDPPREQAGASEQILDCLQNYGLHWDGKVRYQSERGEAYESWVQTLLQQQRAFYCTCSRKQILEATGSTTYPGTCRHCHQPPAAPHAIRVQVPDSDVAFSDAIQGPVACNLRQQGGDYIIKRKEGLYAYHLAVVLDDADQGVTHIVRGCDLLEPTFCQWHLQSVLGLSHPQYAHLPVLVNAAGEKLSKQTFAEPLPRQQPWPYLLYCLQALGQRPPASLRGAAPQQILQWGSEHWSLAAVPRQRTVPLETLHPPNA
ncbi:MAG: tRNA glutamyl-Q(34) synthetase GluQRS [Pseudomonadota bacterium]|nr:tRNA glutamyl-Q(34) synthetase GluQRS [Pseudomonadota bacterium]